MRNLLVILLVSFCLLSFSSIADPIRILGEQSKEDKAHQYFIELIELAIKKSSPKYPHQQLEILKMKNTTHGRTLNLLEKEFVDIFWAGTNVERERRFIPIRIPLFFGLLGYRVSIIHKDSLPQFTHLNKHPEQLKSLTACQGEHWPDSDILENNGYKVFRVARFDLMFKMLNHKRCDYFPRAIFEGYSELEVAKEQFPELMMFDQLILHYPFAIYFFVNKNNPILAEQIEYGLKEAIADGSLMAFMKTHPLSSSLFPLNKWKDKRYLKLINANMSAQTPGEDSNYWLKLFP